MAINLYSGSEEKPDSSRRANNVAKRRSIEEGQVDRCISVDNKETGRSFVKLSVERYISILFTRYCDAPSSRPLEYRRRRLQARRKFGDIPRCKYIHIHTHPHTRYSVIDGTKNISLSQIISICQNLFSKRFIECLIET